MGAVSRQGSNFAGPAAPEPGRARGESCAERSLERGCSPRVQGVSSTRQVPREPIAPSRTYATRGRHRTRLLERSSVAWRLLSTQGQQPRTRRAKGHGRRHRPASHRHRAWRHGSGRSHRQQQVTPTPASLLHRSFRPTGHRAIRPTPIRPTKPTPPQPSAPSANRRGAPAWGTWTATPWPDQSVTRVPTLCTQG